MIKPDNIASKTGSPEVSPAPTSLYTADISVKAVVELIKFMS